jgi:hypothetical protein
MGGWPARAACGRWTLQRCASGAVPRLGTCEHAARSRNGTGARHRRWRRAGPPSQMPRWLLMTPDRRPVMRWPTSAVLPSSLVCRRGSARSAARAGSARPAASAPGRRAAEAEAAEHQADGGDGPPRLACDLRPGQALPAQALDRGSDLERQPAGGEQPPLPGPLRMNGLHSNRSQAFGGRRSSAQRRIASASSTRPGGLLWRNAARPGPCPR